MPGKEREVKNNTHTFFLRVKRKAPPPPQKKQTQTTTTATTNHLPLQNNSMKKIKTELCMPWEYYVLLFKMPFFFLPLPSLIRSS